MDMFKPKTPVVPDTNVEPLPTPDDAEAQRNNRRESSIQRRRSGIQSTVLSRRSSRETLGG